MNDTQAFTSAIGQVGGPIAQVKACVMSDFWRLFITVFISRANDRQFFVILERKLEIRMVIFLNAGRN